MPKSLPIFLSSSWSALSTLTLASRSLTRAVAISSKVGAWSEPARLPGEPIRKRANAQPAMEDRYGRFIWIPLNVRMLCMDIRNFGPVRRDMFVRSISHDFGFGQSAAGDGSAFSEGYRARAV